MGKEAISSIGERELTLGEKKVRRIFSPEQKFEILRSSLSEATGRKGYADDRKAQRAVRIKSGS